MKRLLLSLLILAGLCAHAQETFTNPLLPNGADPYSFYKDGYYYYTHTTGRNLQLWKSANLADLKSAEHKVVYTPPKDSAYSKELWAPQIHFIRGKWYMYFAADDGRNEHHRMYVVENASPDPLQGEWVFKGKVADPTNKWAIDADVFEYNGEWYMVWSGWEGDKNGSQDIYIAKMINPWTIGERVKIAKPEYTWEQNGKPILVNEGPQALMHGKKLFIVYSASGCWTDFYALGLLTFTGKKNLLDAKAWKKSPEPLFQSSKENGVYAPGHNSFFKSPNGKEDWLLYHANDNPGDGCGGKRSPRMQKFTWKKDGTPDFGVPVKNGVALPRPAM